MEKVILFYLERPDIKISMEMYFTEKGQLFFDGYDIGKTVEEVWGDSEYEYTYVIEPDQVEKIYEIYDLKKDDKNALLAEIKKCFSGNNAYSLFGEFLNTHNIKYESFTWS